MYDAMSTNPSQSLYSSPICLLTKEKRTARELQRVTSGSIPTHRKLILSRCLIDNTLISMY